MAYKEQWLPLLGPGFHIHTLDTLEKMYLKDLVSRFCGEICITSLRVWCKNFWRLGIPCEFWIDGSFVTEKPEPGDVDIAIKVMDDVMRGLNEDQRCFLENISGKDVYIKGLDIFVFAGYWIGHDFYGTDFDAAIRALYQLGVSSTGRAWMTGLRA